MHPKPKCCFCGPASRMCRFGVLEHTISLQILCSERSDHGARAGPSTWSPPRLGQGFGTLLVRLLKSLGSPSLCLFACVVQVVGVGVCSFLGGHVGPVGLAKYEVVFAGFICRWPVRSQVAQASGKLTFMLLAVCRSCAVELKPTRRKQPSNQIFVDNRDRSLDRFITIRS